MPDPQEFLDDFHAARSRALRERLARSHEWWRGKMVEVNLRTAHALRREGSIACWIALAAAGVIAAFWRI